MYSKSSKGSVGVESFQGRLRLRLPRQLYDGKQKYLTIGLDDNKINRRIAESKAAEIEKDIVLDVFDYSLVKYKPSNTLSITPKVDLNILWNKYVEYKSHIVQLTTVKITYRRINNHILSFPTTDCNDATAIRDWLLDNKTVDTTKRVLTHLSACCDWGVDNGMLVNNLFKGLAAKLKTTNINYNNIDPFSVDERDAIIAAFENHKHYNYYTSFVKFLFLTGARTSEVIGLQWKHISSDCKQILFSESINSQYKIRKDTKNHKSRKFPCNDKLRNLLLDIRPNEYNLDDLVFTDSKGKLINSNVFLTRVWKGYTNCRDNYIVGIVNQLVSEGKVKRYRPQYNTRHTFITMAIESNMPINQVAKLVGNSVEVISNHYLGNIANISVPEF